MSDFWISTIVPACAEVGIRTAAAAAIPTAAVPRSMERRVTGLGFFTVLPSIVVP
ncbi:hypothetical protein GCM10009675_29610 [Prauserella alba]|uniref:Uncharacterized protein n=1 Tax=Prauserella alba TaxID=176898 RepID=A0ABN1VEK4_9PSEU